MDIQSLSFYGIFSESFTIIFSSKKLFSQITIATIFPLSLIFLGYVQISEFLFPNIVHNEEGPFKNLIWGSLWSEKIVFFCANFIYFIFFLVLSLISTSVIVYAVACIYMGKETSFVEVISVVPKVWRRLMVTFAWSFMVVFAYNTASSSLLFPMFGLDVARIAITGPLFVVYVMGFVYISIIWHLASVVSVLEEDCGIGAMIKSKELAKGKMVISVAVFLLLNLCFILIQMVFQRFVVFGGLFWCRVMCGIVCFLFLSGFTLLGNVVQTIVYLVCASRYYEIIVNGVEVCSGDYAAFRDKEDLLDQLG